MKFQDIPLKIVKRLSHHIYKLAGKDSISSAKILGRNDLKELGSEYGGWVIPSSLFRSDSVCYCVGCGEDISFDLGLIDAFGCDVYGFDPTPRAIAYVKKVAGPNPKYHFHDIGLWDKEDTLKFFVPKNPNHVSHSLVNLQKTEEYLSVNVNRLSNVMSSLGHQNLDLLKIDIEGAEYKVIESIIEDGIDVKVICVEYDECFNPLNAKYKERIRDSVNSLIENGYSLVCAQGNGNYTLVRNA
ncbi:MAG: FkbM family methyltransferase [Solirubrobacterales bacterium]|nr:FkbM family methyltransferase [Solirubrobacterales bacterium]